MKNIKAGDAALTKAKSFYNALDHRDLCTAYTMQSQSQVYKDTPGDCRCNRKAVLALAELIDMHGDGCTPESCECFRRGLESVLFQRCVKHYSVPQLNRTEHKGGECGACIQDEERERVERQASPGRP